MVYKWLHNIIALGKQQTTKVSKYNKQVCAELTLRGGAVWRDGQW